MEDDKKWLYEQFTGANYNVGSYEDFVGTLNNKEDRDWYYEESKGLGLDFKDREDFESLYGPAVNSQATVGNNGVQKTVVNDGGGTHVVQSVVQPQQNTMQDDLNARQAQWQKEQHDAGSVAHGSDKQGDWVGIEHPENEPQKYARLVSDKETGNTYWADYYSGNKLGDALELKDTDVSSWNLQGAFVDDTRKFTAQADEQLKTQFGAGYKDQAFVDEKGNRISGEDMWNMRSEQLMGAFFHDVQGSLLSDKNIKDIEDVVRKSAELEEKRNEEYRKVDEISNMGALPGDFPIVSKGSTFDPDKFEKNIEKARASLMSKNEATIKELSKTYGVKEEFIRERFKNIVDTSIAQGVVEKYEDLYGVRDLGEYVFIGGLENSLFGKIVAKGMMPEKAREIRQSYMQEYGENAGSLAGLSQFAVTLLADSPFFKGFGAVSGGVMKLAPELKSAGKYISAMMDKGLSREAAVNTFNALYAQSFGMRLGSDLVKRVGSSALTLGQYEGAGALLDGQDYISGFKHGMGTGAAFGVFHQLNGALTYGLQGAKKVLGWGTGILGETGVLTGMERMDNWLAGQENKDDFLTATLKNVGTALVMRYSNGELFGSLKRLRDNVRNGFRDVESPLELNADNWQELKEAGYDLTMLPVEPNDTRFAREGSEEKHVVAINRGMMDAAFHNIIDDPNISMETKHKMEYLFGGKMTVANADAIRYERSQMEDGRIKVTTYNADGEVMGANYFADVERANRFEQQLDKKFEADRVNADIGKLIVADIVGREKATEEELTELLSNGFLTDKKGNYDEKRTKEITDELKETTSRLVRGSAPIRKAQALLDGEVGVYAEEYSDQEAATAEPPRTGRFKVGEREVAWSEGVEQLEAGEQGNLHEDGMFHPVSIDMHDGGETKAAYLIKGEVTLDEGGAIVQDKEQPIFFVGEDGQVHEGKVRDIATVYEPMSVAEYIATKNPPTETAGTEADASMESPRTGGLEVGREYQAEITDNESGEKIPTAITIDRVNEDGTFDISFEDPSTGETMFLEKQSESDVMAAITEELRPAVEPQGTEGNIATENIPENGNNAGENILNTFVGRSLSADEADAVITKMETTAETEPSIELTPKNWLKEFGEDGVVSTPLGEVKMGENQYEKLVENQRSKELGMIKPTLERPDIILEQYDPVEGAERDTKYLFIKTFTRADGSKRIHYESVTIKKEGKEVDISNHRIRENQIKKRLQEEKLLWSRFENDSEPSGQVQGLDSEVATIPNNTENGSNNPQSILSGGKGTENFGNVQGNVEKSAAQIELDGILADYAVGNSDGMAEAKADIDVTIKSLGEKIKTKQKALAEPVDRSDVEKIEKQKAKKAKLREEIAALQSQLQHWTDVSNEHGLRVAEATRRRLAEEDAKKKQLAEQAEAARKAEELRLAKQKAEQEAEIARMQAEREKGWLLDGGKARDAEYEAAPWKGAERDAALRKAVEYVNSRFNLQGAKEFLEQKRDEAESKGEINEAIFWEEVMMEQEDITDAAVTRDEITGNGGADGDVSEAEISEHIENGEATPLTVAASALRGMAREGGIDRESIRKHLGLGNADMAGYNFLTKNGGRTIEEIGHSLWEQHPNYFPTDVDAQEAVREALNSMSKPSDLKKIIADEILAGRDNSGELYQAEQARRAAVEEAYGMPYDDVVAMEENAIPEIIRRMEGVDEAALMEELAGRLGDNAAENGMLENGKQSNKQNNGTDYNTTGNAGGEVLPGAQSIDKAGRAGGTEVESGEETGSESDIANAAILGELDFTPSNRVADNGEYFYQDSDGNIDLATIPDEVFVKIGKKAAPFRLTPSMLKHVYDRHGKEMHLADPQDAILFVLDVIDNFDHVRQGEKGAIIFSVENGRSRTGKRAVTILLDSKSGEYYGIKTSGYERVDGLQKRALLWEKGADVTSTTDVASANVPTEQAQQGNELNGSASNQSNALSGGKGTENSGTIQENAEEISKKGAFIDELEQEWDDKIADYLYKHYPTQATVSGESMTEKGRQEREAMKNDPVLKKMLADKEAELKKALEAEVAEEHRVLADAIAEAEATVNTAPTDGQKKAGNYKMGHVKVDGFDVTIENPKGSMRKGVDADGREWSNVMNNTYGYIRGTEGVDGDHIDVFLSSFPELGDIFVVDQYNADGTFDEHKVMYGYADAESAMKDYLANYSKGWDKKHRLDITGVTHDEFKKWIESSHRKTKPFAEYKGVKAIEPATESRRTDKQTRLAIYPQGMSNADRGGKAALKYLKGNLNDLEEISTDDKFRIILRFKGNRIAKVACDGKEGLESVMLWLNEYLRRHKNPIQKQTGEGIEPTPEQRLAGEAVVEQLRSAGIGVSMDAEEMRRVLEESAGRVQEMAVEEASARFDRQLDDFEAKRHKGLMNLGRPKAKLLAAGIDDVELTLSPSVLKQHLNKHGLTTEDLKGLAKAIQNPILVYTHGDNKPNKVVITDLVAKGGKLSISVKLDKEGRVTEINNVSSVHSKDALIELTRLSELREGYLEKALGWVDYNKISDWFNAAGLNRLIHDKSNPKFFSVAKVLENFENLKISEEILRRGGEIYGFVKDGKVYLDPAKLNPNTPIHEYSHLWDNGVRAANPELWKKGVELMKEFMDGELWDDVKNDPDYADIAHDDNLIASEVKARLTGEKGAEHFEKAAKEASAEIDMSEKAKKFTILNRVKEWLKDMWDATKQWLMKKSAFADEWSDDEIDSLSAEDFAKMTLRDLMAGVNPNKMLAEIIGENGTQNIERMPVQYFIGKKARAMYEALLDKKQPNMPAEWKKEALDYLHSLEDTKENGKKVKVAVNWLANGTIRLPEDMPKVEDALSVAEKAKVDPMQYKSPMELLDAHKEYKPSRKPIDPDTVATLTNKQELPNGIVVYDVEDSEESRQNMREIINTHFGEDCSPWCLLQGDGEGNLTEQSADYWEHYNSIQKQVAFKDGKLLAFRATDEINSESEVRRKILEDALIRYGLAEYDAYVDDYSWDVKLESDVSNDYTEEELRGFANNMGIDHAAMGSEDLVEAMENLLTEEVNDLFNKTEPYDAYASKVASWWDRKDDSHVGIPATVKLKDLEGATGTIEMLPDGTQYGTVTDVSRGDRKNGLYEEFYHDGEKYVKTKSEHYVDGKRDGLSETFSRKGVLLTSGEFRKGSPVGEHIIQYEDGYLQSKTIYSDKGALLDDYDYYHHNRLRLERHYKDGVNVESIHYSMHGDVTGVERSYSDEDGLHTEIRTYHLNGSPMRIAFRLNNRQHGEWVEYYEDGSLKSKGTWVEGQAVGDYVEYFEDGNLKKRTRHNKDGKQTLSETYYGTGELRSRTENEYDKEGERIRLTEEKYRGSENNLMSYRKEWTPYNTTVEEWWYDNGQQERYMKLTPDWKESVEKSWNPDGGMMYHIVGGKNLEKDVNDHGRPAPKYEAESEDDGLRFRDGDSSKRDAAYQKAVESGDVETAQAMVDAKAEDVFKDSKVRDEDGKLLKVYHGTYADFNKFDIEMPRKNSDIQGHFFSPWELDSKGYGPNVRAFYLNLKNPADEATALKAWSKFKGEDEAGVKTRKYLESLGYDGANMGGEEYIVFDSENIKLADADTYDDNGRLIPLSERFNEDSEDIRTRMIGERGAYMADFYDNQKRMENKQLAEDMELEFKEKKARVEKLRKSEAIEITGEEYKGKYKLNRESAQQWIKDNLRGVYTNTDTGETIELRKDGAQKVTSHSMGNEAHLKSIVAIPQLIEHSIFIDELPNEKGNGKYDSYRYYVCGMNIGGEEYTVKVTVGVKGKNKYYDHSLTQIEKGSLIDNIDALSSTFDADKTSSTQSDTEGISSPTISESVLFGGKDKRLIQLLQINEQEIAKKIKKATGWERGKDGKWRYEEADDLLTDEQIQQMRDGSIRFLGDLMGDVQLFKEYPQLKEIGLAFWDSEDMKGDYGYYDHENTAIRINNDMPDDMINRTFVHEIQHAIQEIEGFATGTDAKYLDYDEYHRGSGEVEARNVGRRMYFDDERRRNTLAEETEDVAREDQIVTYGDGVAASAVTDTDLQQKLDSEPTVKVYRAMVMIDGKLYSPMASKENKNTLTKPIELGKWEQADERPDKAYSKKNAKGEDVWYFDLLKDNGEKVPARYNPYIHTSRSPLNDQFASAYKRPNLVTVEVEVPVSELTSGYKADKAKDSVGEVEWKSGVVSSQLAKKGDVRKVILSRWDKPIRVVPDIEVADMIAEKVGKDIAIPENVVTPSLRAELEKKGVNIEPYKKPPVSKRMRMPDEHTDGERFIIGHDENGYYVEGFMGNFDSKEKLLEAMRNRWRENGYVFNPGRTEIVAMAYKSAKRTPKQQRAAEAYAERAQKRAVRQVEAVANTLRLAGVEVITDSSKLTGRRAKAKGWYDTKSGQIKIVLVNHRNEADVMRTLLHEGVAHHGLRHMFGEHFDTFLDNVYNNAEERIKKEIDDVVWESSYEAQRKGKEFNEEKTRREAMEEYMARLAEDMNYDDNANTHWYKRFLENVREAFIKMLAKVGLRLDKAITDNDIRYILWRSYQTLKGRYKTVEEMSKDIVMQRNLKVRMYEPTEQEMKYAAETQGVPEKVIVSSSRKMVREDERLSTMHQQGKSGSVENARRFVAAVAKLDKFNDFAKEHPDAVVVPVRAAVENAWNEIPTAYAEAIGNAHGLVVDSNITQKPKEWSNWRAPQEERILRQSEFEGDVEAGREYLLVDDHVTFGETLNSLRRYIEDNGGKVVGVTALTYSPGATSFRISERSWERLKKYDSDGNIEQDLIGRGYKKGFADLTEKEAKYLLDRVQDGFGNVDVILAAEPVRDNGLMFRGGGKAEMSKPKTYAERMAEAKEVAERAIGELGNEKLDGEKQEEARKAVSEFIRKGLDSKNMPQLKKQQLNKIMSMVQNVKNARMLRRHLASAETIIKDTEIARINQQIDRLLKIRKQGRNLRGVSIAATVDERARQIFDYIKGETNELMATALDEEIKELNKNKLATKTAIDKVLADNSIGIPYDDEAWAQTVKDNGNLLIDNGERLVPLREMLETYSRKRELMKERDEIRNSKRPDALTSWQSEYDALMAKFDDMDIDEEGNVLNAPTRADYDRMEALTILKEINQAKMLETTDSVDPDTGQPQMSIASMKAEQERLMEQNKELRKSFHDAEERDKPYIRQQIAINNEQSDNLNVAINAVKEQQISHFRKAQELIEDVLEGGRARLQARKQAEQERKQEIILKAYDDIKTDKEWVQYDRQGRAKNLTKREGVNDYAHLLFAANLQSLAYMAQNISNRLSGRGYIYRNFIEGKNGVLAAERDYAAAMRNATVMLNEASRRFTDMDYRKAESKLKSYRDKDCLTVTLSSMDEKGKVHQSEQKLCKGSMMYLHQLYRSNDGRMKLMAMGFTDDTMQEIRDFLGEKLVAFAEWMQDEYYPQLRERMNARHNEIYLTSMAKIDNYVPIKIDPHALRGKSQMVEGAGASYHESLEKRNGSLINRTVNMLPIDLTRTALDILGEHTEKNEEWIAFARLRQDMDYILNSKAFREQMNANSVGSYTDFEEAARIALHMPAEQTPSMDRLAIAVSGGYVTGAIAWRWNTAIKQLLSLPAFAAYSQNPIYLAHFAKNLVNSPGSFFWMKKNSPIFRKRIEEGLAGSSDIQRELESLDDGKFKSFLTKYAKWGMSANKLFDAIAYASGAKAVYDFEYPRMKKRFMLEGMSEEQAEKEAHDAALMRGDALANESQQSNVGAYKSAAQVSKTFMGRMMSVFKQAVIGYARKTVLAGNDLYSVVFKHAETKKHLMDDLGMTGTQAEWDMFNTGRKAVVSIAIFGFFLNWLWDSGNDTTAAMLGLTGDGDNDQYKDADEELGLARKVMLYGSYFIQGSPAGTALHDFASMGKYDPMSISGKLVYAGKDIYKVWDEYHVSPELIATVLTRASALEGVDIETLANICISVQDMVDHGFNENLAMDIAFILNMPKSTREMIARTQKEHFTPIEYAEAMAYARKLNGTNPVMNILTGRKNETDKQRAASIEEWMRVEAGKDVYKLFKDASKDGAILKQIGKYWSTRQKPTTEFEEQFEREHVGILPQSKNINDLRLGIDHLKKYAKAYNQKGDYEKYAEALRLQAEFMKDVVNLLNGGSIKEEELKEKFLREESLKVANDDE